MADDTDCDVTANYRLNRGRNDESSNGEVFDDVHDDPTTILQNVEKNCIRVLVPSMAESSMSKMEHAGSEDGDEHDVKFVPLEADDDSQQGDHDGRSIVDEHRRGSISGPRAVKWTLETMAMAIDSVLAGELTTTNASRQFGIPRTTLLDRLAMKVKRQHLESPGTFPLSPENTLKIVDFYHQNSAVEKPTLLRGILALADELAIEQGTPFETPLHTRKWLKLFVQKHPDLSIIQYTRARIRSSASYSPKPFGPRGSVTMAPFLGSQMKNEHHAHTGHLIQLQLPAELNPFTAQQVAQVVTTNGHGNHQGHATPHEVMSPPPPAHLSQHTNLQQHPSCPSSEEHSPTQSYDSFEAALAKQGLDAVERKLSTEQRGYFNYRFHNINLERGYDLWKMCKTKSETIAEDDTFESMVAGQALTGIEDNLPPEYLKYFKFRHENPELEEGYKLWSVLKTKTLKTA